MEDEHHPPLSSNEEEQEVSTEQSASKKPRLEWQDALLTLMAAQQEQLAILSRQTNMATGSPAPSTSMGAVSTSAQASTSASVETFRLAEFNPDVSNNTIEEWLDVASNLKEELGVGDSLMIAKAGEALKGRAHRYYCEWRPVRRTWQEFVKDLVTAFPDRETPGARAYSAATLRSRDCETLSDYGNQKLNSIRRFNNNLPWATVVSMVEYGLDHSEAQASIRIQPPLDQRELLKTLSEFDARHPKRTMRDHRATGGMEPRTVLTKQSTFRGSCFRCGKMGHSKSECRAHGRVPLKKISDGDIQKEKPEGSAGVPSCTHCKKIGHTEKNCWFKHGKPKTVMLVRRRRELASSPIATLLCNNKMMTFSYLIDSGAEVSILSESAMRRLNAVLVPEVRVIRGLGQSVIYCKGTCEVIAVLPAATIEVVFVVVSDDVIPGHLDAIIGWDVISRPNLRIKKNADGLQLCHDLDNIPRVLTWMTDTDINNLVVAELDEQMLNRLKHLLVTCLDKTPNCITTGKLSIKLKDDTPVAYRPRRLAYAERVQVQHIVQELLQSGVIRESQSAYASPIVLVKLKNKYNGPYTVKKILPNERYLLKKGGKRTTVAAHQQLRLWPLGNV